MTVIDDYLEDVEIPNRTELGRIRSIILSVVPDATEVISYGMPGFKYKGKYLIGFNAFKDHLSLFPTSVPIENMMDKLSAFKLSKGTIQFTLDNPIPKEIIKELLLIQVNRISKC